MSFAAVGAVLLRRDAAAVVTADAGLAVNLAVATVESTSVGG